MLPVYTASPTGADCDFCNRTRKEMTDWVVKFHEWLKRPYSEEMSAMGWFLFAGLLLIIGWAWSTIIRKLAD